MAWLDRFGLGSLANRHQRNFPAAPTPVGIDTSGIGKRLVSA
jgi:hypothetical protein